MIKQITDNVKKQNICKEILKDLPEWFGIQESTQAYIDAVVNYPFIAYYDGEEAIGFYSLREENEQTLDMYVLGIKKRYHNKGIGTKLQHYVFDYARDKGYTQCIVLTLSNKHKDSGYALTRKFYHKMGFSDLYESDKIWDEFNPTQIMVKIL